MFSINSNSETVIFNKVNRSSIYSLFQLRVSQQWLFSKHPRYFVKPWNFLFTKVWKREIQRCLGPIVIVVIAAGVIVVVVGIERVADVVDLALSARDFHFVTRCTILAGLHREHLHLFLEAELLRHRADLRVLLLLLLLRQSFLSRIPWESKVVSIHLSEKVTYPNLIINPLNLMVDTMNLLIHFLCSDHSGSRARKRSPGAFRRFGRR